MLHTITLRVSVTLEIETDNPKEVRGEANAMQEYLSEHIKGDLQGKWQGAATVEQVEVK